MQKGDSAKLKLLLAGISARLTKNRDFFVQADCTLVSGKKKFDAKLSRADEDYTLHFQGSDRRVDAAEFCAFFAEQAEKYDESVLTYTERSTVVTLSVTARGVQMKQAEREATAEEKAAAANPLLDSGRQYLIRVDQAAALLREIGILTADGKLKNDLALGTAIRAKAKYIACVPCCHKELLDQYTMPGLEPLTKFGVFKARFNDVLTDSMRALKLEAEGYKVSVVEYISPLDTPKNLLIRATRTGKMNHRAKAEYDAVRRTLGTTSELDRRCAELDNEFFVTDEDLMG
ncbi:MAG: hypothetical protein ACLVFS_05755 [Butyricicoccus sp.]